MAISSRGRDFVVRHEGFVSRAYRCPAGEWTIGTGFTNRSSVAVQLLGRIKPGKTITRAENDRVLAEAFARDTAHRSTGQWRAQGRTSSMPAIPTASTAAPTP